MFGSQHSTARGRRGEGGRIFVCSSMDMVAEPPQGRRKEGKVTDEREEGCMHLILDLNPAGGLLLSTLR